MFFIGVDVGKRGAIGVIPKDDPTAYQVFPYSDEKLKEVCETYSGNCKAIVEQVHSFPRDSNQGAFNFGCSFGFVQGMLTAFGIPYQLVPPQKWQKEYSLGSKTDSIETAKRLFPGINLLPTERSRKESDGMSDAILICEYGRRHMK